MKITLNTCKIVDEFGNLNSFAKTYGISLATLNHHVRYRHTDIPYFRKENVFKAIKKMQADGYITIEYHSGN
ncbi:hypothetical protein [Helicobacter salomonis]|uniref:hypothetical protein n=1 Tax=Helicobacter salomonis TaxID=56878 RepID=UPI000CF13C1E|nr:hypothetical protein [Helicobacter salomonis]